MSKNADAHSRGNPPRRDPLDSGAEALAWAVSSGTADNVAQRLLTRDHRRQRRRLLLAAGAAALALVLAAGWQWQGRSRPAAPLTAESRSAVVSHPAREVLPDGSIVELRENARIAVAFTPETRRVQLLGGEAHFQVAKNPARPFVVAANGIEVRAVGTAFDVQIGPHAVDVLVTEGRVSVHPPVDAALPLATPSAGTEPAAALVAMVDAGYRVAVDVASNPAAARPPVVAASPAEREARLAWRVPRLEFSNTPLREVIPLFNRYGQSRLVLDPALGRLEMSGALRADDVDSLLLLLQNEFAIRAEPRAAGEVYLVRR